MLGEVSQVAQAPHGGSWPICTALQPFRRGGQAA